MRMRLSLVALLATFAVTPIAAHADTVNFNFSDPTGFLTASGTLTGTPDPTASTLLLSGITGSGATYSFTGVVPVGSNSDFSYDNLLFTSPDVNHVDSKGVLLDLTSFPGTGVGTSLAHIFSTGVGLYEADVFDPGDPGAPTDFAFTDFTVSPVSSVPEPSTFLLLGTGLLGAAGAFSRRPRRS